MHKTSLLIVTKDNLLHPLALASDNLLCELPSKLTEIKFAESVLQKLLSKEWNWTIQQPINTISRNQLSEIQYVQENYTQPRIGKFKSI